MAPATKEAETKLDVPPLPRPERDQKIREAARRYLRGELDYRSFTLVRRSLYDTRRREHTGSAD